MGMRRKMPVPTSKKTMRFDNWRGIRACVDGESVLTGNAAMRFEDSSEKWDMNMSMRMRGYDFSFTNCSDARLPEPPVGTRCPCL
jgi:hypothetical protein